MLLEDFFTLTEMNNGITTPSRVEELVTIMVNERDRAMKNVGDTTRQWSAVANAIIATESKDCLDLFIQLDGLHFIYNWLKDAKKLSNDTFDSIIEESVVHLLQVLVKLQVSNEKLFPAEIWTTVQDFLFHNNAKVQDTARVLFKRKKVDKTPVLTVGNSRALIDDGVGKGGTKKFISSEYCLRDASLSSEASGKEVQDLVRGDLLLVQFPNSDMLHYGEIDFGLNSDENLKLWSYPRSKKHHETLNNPNQSPVDVNGKINKLDLCIRDDVAANDYNAAQKELDREFAQSSKKSTINIDYGIVDPLEFARQVAIEVEREVVDNGEQSYSSDNLHDRNVQQTHSSDSVSQNRSDASDVSSKEAANVHLSGETYSMQEESATNSESIDTDPDNSVADVEISQVIEASQEEMNKDKSLSAFDLNVDVCSEDADHSIIQFSAPVSVVSASRAVAAPGLPLPPLKFEGNLGWKGSAATSAFRPASSHRKLEGNKDLSAGGSSCGSKQRLGFLDIDLNVTENRLATKKQVLATSSLPSGESSVEMNSRSEHIELDLNLASEDTGVAVTDWHARQIYLPKNGRQSLFNSSLSSKQPFKNIDLNDPSFPNGSMDLTYSSKFSQNLNFSRAIKSNDSAISIMGTRIEVYRKDIAFQTAPFPHNQCLELPYDVNMGRTGSFLGIGSVLPYVHSSVYSYTPTASVTAPALPFSSTINGHGAHVPCMVDSRGAPVIPQVVNPNSSHPTNFSQPPFVMNMIKPTSNGSHFSRSNFDLNSETMMEGANRDPIRLGYYLNSSPVRLMDEQLRLSSQPTFGSVLGGKRKEPETGWEHSSFKPFAPP